MDKKMSSDLDMFKSRCTRGNPEGIANNCMYDFVAQKGAMSWRNQSLSCWCIHSVYKLWE